MMPQMSDLNMSKTKPIQTKTKDIAKTMVLVFFTNSDMLGIKNDILKLENSMVASDW